MIEELIYQVLSPLAPVAPFADADPTQDPRITYFRVSDSDHDHLAGAGPCESRMQIDVWGTSKKTICLLEAQARVALRAGARVGAITGNPDKFDPVTKFHAVSFDASLWT